MEGVILSQSFQTLRLVLITALSVVIIVSNIFCVAVLRRAKDIKKVTRICLVSMSLADLAMGLVVLPSQLPVLAVELERSLQKTLCMVHVTLHTLFSGASLLSVLLITLECYVAIEFPLRHRSLVTTRRAYIGVACVWLICCANAAVVGTFAATADFYHDDFGTCIPVSTTIPMKENPLGWLQIVLFVAVQLIIIIAIYTRILVLVRRHIVRHEIVTLSSIAASGTAEQPAQDANLNCKSRSLALHRKPLCTFLLVISVSVLTYVPALVVLCLEITGNPVSGYAAEAARFSLYCFGWLNVAVYSIRNKSFRQATKSVFCSRCH